MLNLAANVNGNSMLYISELDCGDCIHKQPDPVDLFATCAKGQNSFGMKFADKYCIEFEEEENE